MVTSPPELDGVGEQVHHALAQVSLIAFERDCRRRRQMQRDAGGLRLRAHQAHTVAQELAQVEHRLAQRQVVGNQKSEGRSQKRARV
jgi:hypothetical protein